jgi:hypothetical protein
MKTAKRVLALILGGLFGFVELSQIPKFQPSNPAEYLGRWISWGLLTAMALYLVGYGIGVLPRPKKEPETAVKRN